MKFRMGQEFIKQVSKVVRKNFRGLKKELFQSAPNSCIRFHEAVLGPIPSTGFQGHSIVISCILFDATLESGEKSDNIALWVNFDLIYTSNPKMKTEIVWGPPFLEATPEWYESPDIIEAKTFPNWVDVSDKNLEVLYQDIPRLCRVFKEVIVRGYQN